MRVIAVVFATHVAMRKPAPHNLGDIVPLDLRILRILLPVREISDVKS
jgi:hypothetical protein